MRCITRIHLSDCGWHEAYYPGTGVFLADPRTGEPVHTVFSLENTGGKTSFLSLVLSCFDTSERRFLKTLIRPNQKFGDYFGDVPAFILVEWDLSGGQSGLLEAERLVTGQVVVPRGEGRQRELERRFFTFRSVPGLSFDDIPAPGLAGLEQHGRLRGHRDVQQWLHAMRSDHPGNFQDFVRQSDWKRKLAEEKIDTELLKAQVDFNRSEGGIEEFLDFRSEAQFLWKFLAMTVPDGEASAVRGLLAEHVAKLSDLPRLQRRRDAMDRLREKFAPFVAVAAEAQSASEEVSRRSRDASSLKTALDEHADRARQLAEESAGAAERNEATADEAEAARGRAKIELASAAVETARRRHEAAVAAATACEEGRVQALARNRLLQATVSMRDILDDRARSETLREAIDAEHADLTPRRDALRGIGADLVATLGRRAASLRERQCTLSAEVRELREAALAADAERTTASDTAQAERREAERIDVDLGHARDFRAGLEEDRVIGPGEGADEAARRHAEAARTAEEEAVGFRRRAEAADLDAARHRERQGDLKAERSTLESEAATLRTTAREGEEKRRDLAFDPTVLELSGESDIDPDSEAVARLLADARSRCTAGLREDERRQEVLQADRESLEATGLASIDTDVRAVAERLRDSGVVDAQPYAVYLSDILRSPGELRRFAEHDPARFAGVAVPNRNALDAARRALETGPPPSRPVTVAVAGDTPGEAAADRFVLPVDEPAAYDREAARELRLRIDNDLEDVSSSIDARQTRIEQLESILRELEAWRERFGGGRLDGMWRYAERKEARIAEIAGEIDVLSRRIDAAGRDARDYRGQAGERDGEAHACTERSRRAEEYHAQWGSRVDVWRRAHLAHRQRAVEAERLAREKEAERDRRDGEAAARGNEAAEAADRASVMEREAGGIAYSGPGGRADGELDALRRAYERDLEALTALERERVGELRGQHQEIERALADKEDRFAEAFGDLERATVEAEAARDGLREAATDAESALEAAREAASTARAEADGAGKDYRTENERQTREIRPEPLTEMRSLTPEALARIAPRAEVAIVEQEAIVAREADAGRRAREEAARHARTAASCADRAATLGGVLSDDDAPAGRMELPREAEVAALVNATVAALGRARDALGEAHKAVYGRYDDIRRFANSDAFRELKSEREVAAHLGASDPLVAAENAERTAGLIDDRLKTIEHDLSRLDDDLEACIAELERLLRTALHILKRMVRDGRIPDHVPRFGGQPVFRMSADLSRISVDQRREILRGYVTDLAETDRIPETGQDIAAELVERMTAALGRDTLGIRLLKPKGEGDSEHMPINRVSVSGGELLTAAMMIYLVLARLRAEAMHGGSNEGGVLIMDNPLGKANKALLLKTQIGLADAMGIQLFYTTGVQDTNALAEFENIVRLRRIGQSRGSRRIHVEVEAMRAHIDRRAAEDTAGSAVAAE